MNKVEGAHTASEDVCGHSHYVNVLQCRYANVDVIIPVLILELKSYTYNSAFPWRQGQAGHSVCSFVRRLNREQSFNLGSSMLCNW
eukprot:1161219-Pleurochrysis_carterae.AAC.2